MELQEKLLKARKAKGFSAADVAYKLGIHPNTYYLYENGKQEPKKPTLIALGQILGTKLT